MSYEGKQTVVILSIEIFTGKNNTKRAKASPLQAKEIVPYLDYVYNKGESR